MAPAIPDRWLDYTPVGKNVLGTRFIAFKVPLRENVVDAVEKDIRLSCQSLMKKIPNLGMIIDLTNTKRYYEPDYFEGRGVIYKKLMIPGHVIPPQHFVEEFKMMVNNFLRENSKNGKLIGVHCTHGVNRTGYLISSFMISELKMKPNEAIKRVEEARGHHIERKNYRDHLATCDTSSTNWRLNERDQQPPYISHRERFQHRNNDLYRGPAFGAANDNYSQNQSYDHSRRQRHYRDRATPYGNSRNLPRNERTSRWQRNSRDYVPNTDGNAYGYDRNHHSTAENHKRENRLHISDETQNES